VDVFLALPRKAEVRMSIVVVDDDDGIRSALQDVLRAEGYATAGAANGKRALELLRRTEPPPRLILLDLMMPVMDGWEFLKEIDDEPKLRGISVAIMSAHPSIRKVFEERRRQDGLTQLLLHGSTLRLLPKPVTLPQLLSVVREVCAGVRAPRAARLV
jgi:CheY-like chemotaxis protein